MFLFAAVCIAWTVLGFFVFDEDEPSTEDDRRVDWVGAALVTVGLIFIVFVLSDSPTASKGWNNPREYTAAYVRVFLARLTKMHR